MRCLALAQAMSGRGAEVIFAVRNSTAKICLRRNDWVGIINLIPEDIHISQEAKWLANLVTSETADFLCIDGYQFDKTYRQAIYEINCKHLCFDDLNELHELPTDLLINGASNASSLNYQSSAPDAMHCLGDKYRVLRQEFVTTPNVTFQLRQKLTLVFGGSDPSNITLPLLKALEVLGFGDKISVVTGAAYSCLSSMQKFISQTQLDIEHLHDCQQMAELFMQSRLTVSAAGGSQFEVMACASPAILVVVADNQINATEQAVSQHWCEMFDARNGFDHEGCAMRINQLWQQQQMLEEMSVKANLLADCLGAERVIDAITRLRVR